MKKKLFFILSAIIITYFIINPKSATNASFQGISLWYTQILPTLLPCTILSSILLSSNIFEINRNTKRIQILCQLITLLCGLTFGCPIGSKLTCDFYNKNLITKKQARLLCSVSNNISPAFVSSFVLTNILGLNNMLIQTYFILYGPPLIYALIKIFTQKTTLNYHKKSASRFQLNMQIIDAGIINGFTTLIKLCGYIVMFSIIVSIITIIPCKIQILVPIITGITEVTNGIILLKNLTISVHIKYILSILFLSFGGISCIMQTSSIISDTNLSIKEYVKNKIAFTEISTTLAIIYCICINY